MCGNEVPDEDEIEITPEMTEAGVAVLADEFGVVSEFGAEEIAQVLFSRMIRAAGGLEVFCRHAQDSRSG